MRVYNSQSKNVGYFIYRMVSPIFDPIRFYLGVTGYFWYIRDAIKYNSTATRKIKFNLDLFPILNEKISYTPFDAHYFYQQLWTFEHILKSKTKEHVDIGSTYEMSGYISKIAKATFVDLRPIKTSLKNLSTVKGDILNLPYKSDSVKSLSCLHVVEHIGLGRYGDPIDPRGTEKACKELKRVLAKGGKLYFSTPMGKDRICFNAHRISSPDVILKYFKGLTLISFSVITDEGEFYQDVEYNKYKNMHYGCGLFLFTKK